MQKAIVATAFISLALPLGVHAQTTAATSSCANLTDPVARATCIATTTLPATPSVITPPAVPANVQSVGDALESWIQRSTRLFSQEKSLFDINNPLGSNSQPDPASVAADLQREIDRPVIDTMIRATSTLDATSTDIQAQIAAKLALVQDLLKKIDDIKAATAASSTPSSEHMTPPNASVFNRTLKIGSSGDDVAQLQEFLAQDPSIYPESQITGYFGKLTQAAVGRWQAANNILDGGDVSTNGWGIVGPKTRAAIINQINASSTPASSDSSN